MSTRAAPRRTEGYDEHLIQTVLDWMSTATPHPLAIVVMPGRSPQPVIVALGDPVYCTCADAVAGRPCWHAVAVTQEVVRDASVAR